ncbi:aldo/keto reductase [Humitalea sp. 24SJ18S-53]|uniref:aldo/keto reductase n=1 Tax=Humitalea sp. 24SJ18S-53 TaxID=3422307 RepID=UPI003D66C2EF
MTDGRDRVAVGTTGVRLSRLGMGGGSLASAGDIAAVQQAAWDAGLRYFDTAALYAGGESERQLGRFLAGKPRADCVASTKFGRVAVDGRDVFDYTAAATERSIATSLERLGLDYLDVVFLHDLIPAFFGDAYEARFAEAMAGAIPVLQRLRAKGTIRAIGIALRDPTAALRLLRAARFDAVMLAGECTLLHRGALAELLPHCAAEHIAVVVAAPFETGLLATGAVPGARWQYKPAPPDILARVAAMEQACAAHGVSLPAAAIQFPLRQPGVVGIVAGHQTVDQVATNLALLETPVPEALWAALAAI